LIMLSSMVQEEVHQFHKFAYLLLVTQK